MRSWLLGLSLVACAGQPATRERAAVPTLAPADTGLLGVAVRMVRAAPGVSRVWPGHWPADRAFLLLRHPDTALLVSPRTPPAEYVALSAAAAPAALRGRAYLRRGYPPELARNHFQLRYPLGGDTVAALEPKGSTLFAKLDFFYHEAFHGYQEGHFAPSPQGDRRVRFRQRLVDSARVAAPEFQRQAEAERRSLVAVLDATSLDSVRALLRGYLALRQIRTGTAPDVQAVERSMERLEGTAQFVGCSAAAAAATEGAARVHECVRHELVQPLHALPDMPEADARLMRWRQYGTGAALALSLDRLGVDWRPAVERGAYLDALAATALGYDPSHAPRLAQEVMRRFGRR